MYFMLVYWNLVFTGPTTSPNNATTLNPGQNASNIVSNPEVIESVKNRTKKSLELFNQLLGGGNVLSVLVEAERTLIRDIANVAFDAKLNETLEIDLPGVEVKLIPIFERGKDHRIRFTSADLVRLQFTSPEEQRVDIAIAVAIDKTEFTDSETSLDLLPYRPMRSANIVPVNGSILQMTVFENKENSLEKVSVPISFSLNLSQDRSSLEFITGTEFAIRPGGISYGCVVLDTKLGQWLASGCAENGSSFETVYCNCDHTSTFAASFSFSLVVIPDFVSYMVLTVEIISVLIFIATLVCFYVARRRVTKERGLTQCNLTLALLLLNIAMAVSQTASGNSISCQVVTVSAHYFLLASFFWMLNYGIVLYVKTCYDPLNFNIGKMQAQLYVLGWVLPALIVALCASIAMPSSFYMDYSEKYLLQQESGDSGPRFPLYEVCWLSIKSNMILAAIVPVSVVIITNTIILFRVMYVVWSMSNSSRKFRPSDYDKGTVQDSSSVIKSAKAFATLSPILGITWLLGFLVNVPVLETIFILIHAISNGVQSVMVFAMLCWANNDIKQVLFRRIGAEAPRRRLTISTTKNIDIAELKSAARCKSVVSSESSPYLNRDLPTVSSHLQ